MKNFGITNELLKQNGLKGRFGSNQEEKAQNLRKLELINCCKESMITLFEMLKIKKTLNSSLQINNIENRSYDSDIEEENKKNDDHIFLIQQIFQEISKTSNNYNSYNSKEIQSELCEHQKKALSWCLYREKYINEEILYASEMFYKNTNSKNGNCCLEEYELSNNLKIYLNVLSGEISLEKTESKFIRGGILADQSRMGKTLIILALILANKGEIFNHEILIPQENCDFSVNKKRKINQESAKTLIITPGEILSHWKKEIDKHLKKDSLKVMTIEDDNEEFLRIADFDVILTTYKTIEKHHKITAEANKNFNIF